MRALLDFFTSTVSQATDLDDSENEDFEELVFLDDFAIYYILL